MPTAPVIFHTKNLPASFARDSYSQYLSKWDSEEKKAVELEARISETTMLYEAYADESIWRRIEPRLVIFTAIDDPHGVYFASETAAPLFREPLATFFLRMNFCTR